MNTLIGFFILVIFSVSTLHAQSRYQRLVVFGDSLSDVGTYSATASAFGGGKFTTNPGKIWIEHIAEALRLAIHPNRYEGLARPTKIIGGFNYAQGGARIALERGQQEVEIEKLGITARSITTQIQYFLQQHKRFQPTDLIFIQGGANDIFSQLWEFQSGRVSLSTALKNVTLAGSQLNKLIQTLKTSGAVNLVVLTLPYIQKTPMVLGMNSQSQAAVNQLVQAFNSQLSTGTRTLGVRLIDLTRLEMAVNSNAAKYGFKNITQPACSLRFLPGDSALYCSPKNYKEANADRTYKYADLIHPTTGFSQVIGRFILEELSAAKK